MVNKISKQSLCADDRGHTKPQAASTPIGVDVKHTARQATKTETREFVTVVPALPGGFPNPAASGPGAPPVGGRED